MIDSNNGTWNTAGNAKGIYIYSVRSSKEGGLTSKGKLLLN